VTTVVLSLVSRLPYWSSSSITGCVPKAWPDVAVADGWVWIASLLAAAGLIVKLLLGPEGVSVPSVADSVYSPAVSIFSPLKVATPFEAAAV
jgi:hypothetical protein